MIFWFRVCEHSDGPDTAYGWVSATSELRARALVGPHAYLQVVPKASAPNIRDETVVVTHGRLDASSEH